MALLVIGPRRLPEMGNAVGKTIREFRKASTDISEATTLEPEAKPAAASPAPASSTPASASAPAPDESTTAAAAAPATDESTTAAAATPATDESPPAEPEAAPTPPKTRTDDD
ncbi:MAG: twin-arginine translocase TatA/TatE family subunit [Chloroflexota bacterium]